MSNRIAIAHKDYDVRGGGEVLAEELARVFDAPLYVGHANEAHLPEHPDIDIREIAPESHLHRLMARTGTALRGLAHMIHWRDNAPDALAQYETVVTSGNEPLWYVPRDYQTVVAYTHSPPRWLYDLYHRVDGFVGRTYSQAQRRLYEGRVKEVDMFVANSDLVARRIRQYWNVPGEQIRVVYPPVSTTEFDRSDAPTQDYYLYLGRLAGHKRVEEVVEAFDRLDAPLKIAGRGPRRDALEARASDNIHFEGYVSEERKRTLFAGAKAVVYPAQNEDFGMVPVEAMAAGTPVIGVNEGFTRFQIQNGKNGYTYERGVSELYDTVRRFERDGVNWSAREIANFVDEWFGIERFHEEMHAVVEQATAETSIEPPWYGEGPGRSHPEWAVLTEGEHGG